MTKKLIVHENLDVNRVNEPVSLGIPFEKGLLHDPGALCLYDNNGNHVHLQASSLNKWIDGSIKWAFIDFQANVDANSEALYRLTLEKASNRKEGIFISREQNSLVVNTGKAQFHIDTTKFVPFTKVTANGKEVIDGRSSRCILSIDGKEIVPEIKELILEHEGPLRATVLIKGEFRTGRKTKADYISRLNFFADKGLVKIDFTLRNPMAAHHPGGLWDLGDKGSQIFEELCLEFFLTSDQERSIMYSLQKNEPFKAVSGQDLLIYQESSGGKNWDSPNHKNRFGKVPLSIKGFQVYEGKELIHQGERATPVVWIGSSETGLTTASTYFWENFPKAVTIKENSLNIGLFPKQYEDKHELQGGEQKTETLYLDFSSLPSELMWVREPLVPLIAPEEYERSGAMPGLRVGECKFNNDYYALINAAIIGDNNIISKREIIDEYGWRNFGEVYADHEAVGSTEKYFISHYNNQYDFLYGALRQFIVTGNLSWYRTMTELASHVRDIDIYHTDEDRDEYNHGLFWHTDHYTDAATSTHRSYSQKHLKEKNLLHYGGGPNEEHCYTTGLMYNYLMTGDRLSREAVIELADWCGRAMGRQTTLVGMFYMFKQKWPLWKNVLMGGREISYRYPLNRGTGNFIVACLDAFELTEKRGYLERAEEFIRGCVHPHDEIESRNLLDAEAHWSYTVFFDAIGRYLDRKMEINEVDFMFAYARESLLSYATWMLENEYPYLDKPEILEYPNETWPAQDMRKSCVFYYASRHCPSDQKNVFIERAISFFDSSVAQLKSFPTRMLTRPLTLLLQNCWVYAYLCDKAKETIAGPEMKFDFGDSHMFFKKTDVLKRIVSDAMFALMRTSLKREVNWIKTRLRSTMKCHLLGKSK